ncbi:MAG: toprim domain-containing protein, partial [Planctomycetota bacterium]
FSEPGSRDGMFFRPDRLSASFVILVEGASDAAAVIDLGFSSVLGRASCRGNVDQILTVCRRLRPKQLLLIPDNDDPGIAGAEDLCSKIRAAGGKVQILNLKDGVKDVRQCVQNPENASWLAGEISKATRHRSIYKHGGVR